MSLGDEYKSTGEGGGIKTVWVCLKNFGKSMTLYMLDWKIQIEVCGIMDGDATHSVIT